jgi:hypothetical protein
MNEGLVLNRKARADAILGYHTGQNLLSQHDWRFERNPRHACRRRMHRDMLSGSSPGNEA